MRGSAERRVGTGDASYRANTYRYMYVFHNDLVGKNSHPNLFSFFSVKNQYIYGALCFILTISELFQSTQYQKS